jgi:hypothetical protein
MSDCGDCRQGGGGAAGFCVERDEGDPWREGVAQNEAAAVLVGQVFKGAKLPLKRRKTY